MIDKFNFKCDYNFVLERKKGCQTSWTEWFGLAYSHGKLHKQLNWPIGLKELCASSFACRQTASQNMKKENHSLASKR